MEIFKVLSALLLLRKPEIRQWNAILCPTPDFTQSIPLMLRNSLRGYTHLRIAEQGVSPCWQPLKPLHPGELSSFRPSFVHLIPSTFSGEVHSFPSIKPRALLVGVH